MKRNVEKPDILSLIRAVPALREIDGGEWERALAEALLMEEPHGSKLSHGPGCDHFAIVLRGALKVRLQAADGRVFSVQKVGAGDICMLSMSRLRAHCAQLPEIMTEGDTLLLRMHGERLDPLLAECPAFRSYFLASTMDCFGRMMGMIEELAFGRLHNRIMSYLGARRAAEGDAVIRVTHQQLGQEVGTTREVVSRVLKMLEKSGEIRLGRGFIQIVD